SSSSRASLFALARTGAERLRGISSSSAATTSSQTTAASSSSAVSLTVKGLSQFLQRTCLPLNESARLYNLSQFGQATLMAMAHDSHSRVSGRAWKRSVALIDETDRGTDRG